MRALLRFGHINKTAPDAINDVNSVFFCDVLPCMHQTTENGSHFISPYCVGVEWAWVFCRFWIGVVVTHIDCSGYW